MDSIRDERCIPEDAQAQQARFLRLFLSAERELFRYVAAMVPGVADAEEIVQQTAVALWSRFDQYDAGRPFAAWACGFAANVVRQWAAGRRRWRALLDPGLAGQLAARREELRPRFESRLQHLDACLAKLPAEQRGIVEAYYFRRHDVDRIAADANRSRDAIYKTLQRVRAMLRECIERAARAGEALT